MLWALANFFASLSNPGLMLSLHLPVQVRIQAVYMPILEFLMLVQFAFWWRAPSESAGNPQADGKRLRVGLSVCVVVCIVAVVTAEISSPTARVALSWAANALWCIETLPQLATTILHPDAANAGQSYLSLMIATTGKSTDALSAYLLVMPVQTRILAYFSSSLCWLNTLFIVTMRGNDSCAMQATIDDPVSDTADRARRKSCTAFAQAAMEKCDAGLRWAFRYQVVRWFAAMCLLSMIAGICILRP